MSTPSPRSAWVPEWSFADRLRKIRRDERLSQDAMALQLSVNPARYSAWESGRNKPEDVVAIAKRLELMCGVPAAWTLGLNAENPRPDGGPDGGSSVRHQGLEPRTRCVSGGAHVVTLRERIAS